MRLEGTVGMILRVAAQMREFVSSALLGFFNTICKTRSFPEPFSSVTRNAVSLLRGATTSYEILDAGSDRPILDLKRNYLTIFTYSYGDGKQRQLRV
jgi:hypothetical protein